MFDIKYHIAWITKYRKRYWGQRLTAIDDELRTEPDRIRDLYDVRAQRIEPVGLIYLWPIAG